LRPSTSASFGCSASGNGTVRAGRAGVVCQCVTFAMNSGRRRMSAIHSSTVAARPVHRFTLIRPLSPGHDTIVQNVCSPRNSRAVSQFGRRNRTEEADPPKSPSSAPVATHPVGSCAFPGKAESIISLFPRHPMRERAFHPTTRAVRGGSRGTAEHSGSGAANIPATWPNIREPAKYPGAPDGPPREPRTADDMPEKEVHPWPNRTTGPTTWKN